MTQQAWSGRWGKLLTDENFRDRFFAGLAGFGVWHLFLVGPEGQPGAIAVSGRIEGDDSAVAAKTSGRIREITVREGDRIEAGQVIASLDDQQIRAREQMAEAAVRQAEARVELSRHQITVLNATRCCKAAAGPRCGRRFRI